MCLAIVAPKGTSKTSDKLFNAIKIASTTNTDGIGFAFKRNSTKKVFISKGYRDVSKVLEELESKKLKESDELIVHLRIGNKGAVNTDMCHPFVCHKDREIVLQNDKYVHDPVLIHNGTIARYTGGYNSLESDTFNFANKFMSERLVQNFIKEDSELFAHLFKDHLGTSRYAFLFPNENTDVIMLGDFKEDGGYYFSNESYKDRSIRNVGGVNYGAGRSYDYDGHDGYNDYSGYGHGYDDYYTGKSREYGRKRSRLNSPEKTPKIDLADLFSNSSNQNSKLGKVIDITAAVSPAKYVNIEIPDRFNFNSVVSEDGTKLDYYMGLWIPNNVKSLEKRYNSINVDVTSLNYHHLLLYALVDDPVYSIEKGTYYEIKEFDNSNKAPHHIISKSLSRKGLETDDVFYTDASDIPINFRVIPKPKYEGFYRIYLDVVSKVAISKKEVKRVNKLLKKDLKANTISYSKAKQIVPRDLLDLFMYNMLQTIYRDPVTADTKHLAQAF